MWIFHAPASVLAIVALSLSTLTFAKPVDVLLEESRDLQNSSQLERRACPNGGTPCGYYGQVCCTSGESCYTDANNQAQCGAAPVAATTGWVYYTTTWVESSLVTRTAVYSSYVGGPVIATPTPSGCPNGGSPCGTSGVCCGMGYYCQLSGTCGLVGGGTSPAATGSPTATVPFQTPIATGVNGTIPIAEPQNGGGGLSGGAIAGIVIGVIAAIILLLLICLYCCARALFDTFMALLGLGKKKRKHTHEETYIEEHHHHSGASGAAGGGRWYGSRPSRPPKKKTGGGNLLGMGAALGGLALALGLKRRHDRKHDDKSTVSGTSGSYSYYTSTSSASSDPHRPPRRPSRHSGSRR